MVHSFETLRKASGKTLETVMREGSAPDLEYLMGKEFDGLNLSPVTFLLGIRKFRKGFYAFSDGVKGYNVKIKQNWGSPEWNTTSVEPERFGFYDLVEPSKHFPKHAERYPGSVLLHYGLENKNSIFAGSILRDFLVMPNPENKDLYLGKAYISLGGILMLPGYFILKTLKK